VFLYRQETLATYRWLVDRNGNAVESETYYR
jgi:hypothetical protein